MNNVMNIYDFTLKNDCFQLVNSKTTSSGIYLDFSSSSQYSTISPVIYLLSECVRIFFRPGLVSSFYLFMQI